MPTNGRTHVPGTTHATPNTRHKVADPGVAGPSDGTGRQDNRNESLKQALTTELLIVVTVDSSWFPGVQLRTKRE